MTSLKKLTETASDLGKDAKDSMEALGRSAGKSLDVARDGTGGALHAVASGVRKTGRKSSEAIDHLATSTAAGLDATASFVEDLNLKNAFTGARKFGQRHPAGTLVAAAAVGFLAGTALRRATNGKS